MSGGGLAYGLNITKKKPIGFRPPPGKRKPIFDDDDDSDAEGNKAGNGAVVEEIGEFGGIDIPSSNAPKKSASKLPSKPPSGLNSKKKPASVYGDLSTSFSSAKHAQTAEELDAGIYDYDAVYDSLKPQKTVTEEDRERKPKYMTSLLAAAAVRKRDATIAEERKLAREREAEGEEFKDKEKFVTSAYKIQQEENRRLEEEEKAREAREAKENKNTGFTSFYKGLLEKDEKRHAEIVKAADERAKAGPEKDIVDDGQERSEAELAQEINEKKAGAITLNDEGQVVDKRQLLKGGLNIIPKAKPTVPSSHARGPATDRSRGPGFVGAGGSKQAMRERQTRMMEAQLEESTKRAREEEEEEAKKVERASKSRKTEGEIMGAKERYLQRKKEAEEAKNKAAEGT